MLSVIEKHKPTMILLWGGTALYSVIGGRWKKDLDTIEKWRGHQIPDQELKAYICPLLSPQTIIYNKLGVEELITNQDLAKAVAKLSAPFPVYKAPTIITLDSFVPTPMTEKHIERIERIGAGHLVTIDYETTGLKPHRAGHKTICMSLAVDADTVYVFPIKNNRMPAIIQRILKNPKIGKIAHNLKYEHNWTHTVHGFDIKGWRFDTMQASHIIDNRTGTTGLKFQTYVELGVIDYDSEVSPYLHGKEDHANAFNGIEEAVSRGLLPKIMEYCALDSINTHRLAMKWMPYFFEYQGETPVSPIRSNYREAYKLVHNGILALSRAEQTGMRVDVKYLEKERYRITKRVETLEKSFYESDFFKDWRKSTPSGRVNLNSGDQLGEYLYKVKGMTPASTTESGKGSTDEEALRQLKIPELDMLTQRSKLMKLRDTYLTGFYNEQVDGTLYPVFNLHLARTYRSSSNNPNFQNIPKRDEQAMNTVRRALYPRKGNQLLEADYSGVEVSIAACYHRDPVMLKYLTDKSTDMHGDMAKQILKLEDFDSGRKEDSTLRSCTKNSFVFPQFYGDYYKSCAVNMCSNWLQIPTNGKWTGREGVHLHNGATITEHLRSQGIRDFNQFTEHMKAVEDDFWGNRFQVYGKWKENHYAQYQRDGYISLYTGFTCGGLMYKNDVSNYPVQGAAFHCLLWTFTELDRRLRDGGFGTRLIGQIHDAVVLDVVPEELVDVYTLIQQVGTEELPIAFPWINVPLKIDAELCPIDHSWAEKAKWKPV